MKLKELSFYSYVLAFNDNLKNSETDYYMGLVEDGTLEAYMLYEKEVLSYAIVQEKDNECLLKYIFTNKNYRNNGHATKLIEELNKIFKSKVQLSIVNNHPSYKIVEHIMNKLNYRHKCFSKVYSIDLNEEYEKTFNSLNPDRLSKFIYQNGYRCIPLSMIDNNIEKQLLNTSKSEFRDPFIVEPNYKKLYNLDLSMAIIKDNVLKAYSLLKQPSCDVLEISKISEAFQERGKGIIFSIIDKTTKIIYSETQIKRLFFTISNTNHSSLSLVSSIIKNNKVTVYDNIYFYPIN